MLLWQIGIGVVIPGVLLSAAWRREGKREGKRRVQGGGGLRVCSVYDGEEGKGGKGRERKGREGGDICAWVLSGYSRVAFVSRGERWTPLPFYPPPPPPSSILLFPSHKSQTNNSYIYTIYYLMIPYLTQSSLLYSRNPTAFKKTTYG